MSRCVPSRKIGTKAAIFKLLAAGVCCLNLVGCSALSVRNDDACHCKSPRQTHLGGSQESQDCQSDDCDEADYQPMLPQIPLPGCLHKWKEHQKLPDGPVGLKFHPLPTRPMFQPRPGALPLTPPWNCPDPNAAQNGEPAPLPIDSSGYGTIPLRSQWSDMQPGSSSTTTTTSNDKPRTIVRAPGIEELPQP